MYSRQCDNYNLKLHRRCNNRSRTNLSGYVGHVTIFSGMFTIAGCLEVGLGLGLGLGLDLVSGWQVLCTHICATLGCNCHTPFIHKLTIASAQFKKSFRIRK